MKKNFTTILLILSSLFVKTNIVCSQVNTQDSLALVDFYNNTNGPNWNNHTNWLTTSPVSTWFDVFVSNNRVTKLGSTSNNLIGKIPSSFGNLSELTELYFNACNFTASFPSSMGNLTKLQTLSMSFNSCKNCSIPASFGNLTSLTNLTLFKSNFGGEIPSSLSNLSNLEYLYLGKNKFTFAGMETIATAFPFASYSPQRKIPLHKNGNVLSVSAGGTLADNTYNWYKNGVLFKTKTGNAHLTINSNGNYSVDVRNAVATTLTLHSDTINYTMFTSLSNDQVNNQDKILKAQLYPNPAKTNTTLSFNADGKYSITITDVSGKILQTRTGVAIKGANVIQLDVGNYASGIYLVTIMDEKNRKQTIRLNKE